MVIVAPDEATWRQVVACAVRAPSVWNSQPWRWRTSTTGGIDLYTDRSRRQITTDPHGRDLLLSCGAGLHHLVVALASLGWSAQITRLPDPELFDHLAHVQPSTEAPSIDTARLAEAIPRRHTDRRRFSADPVSADLLNILVEHAARCGASLHVVAAPTIRQRLVEVIAEAGPLQQQEMGYAAELAKWTGRYAASGDGIPPGSTISSGVDRMGDVPMRPVADGRLRQSPHGLEHDDASVLMLLCTDDDNRLAVLRAGEAASAVMLAATDLGLATTPLSQPLEVAQTRATIRNRILGPQLHPHLVLRVGWALPGAPELTPTPRRHLDRVLLSSGVVP